MKQDLIAQLSRSQREAVESAGYRVMRWEAARGVLQARVRKGRIAGGLGDFLAHWLPKEPVRQASLEFRLLLDDGQNEMKLCGGGTALATSPLEHALLHLPALRAFWRQELRAQHFEALRALVPQAWLLDATPVPAGAVIHGLNLISWEKMSEEAGSRWEIQDCHGVVQADWQSALAARNGVVIPQSAPGAKLSATYAMDDTRQVVLRSLESSP